MLRMLARTCTPRNLHASEPARLGGGGYAKRPVQTAAAPAATAAANVSTMINTCTHIIIVHYFPIRVYII